MLVGFLMIMGLEGISLYGYSFVLFRGGCSVFSRVKLEVITI